MSSLFDVWELNKTFVFQAAIIVAKCIRDQRNHNQRLWWRIYLWLSNTEEHSSQVHQEKYEEKWNPCVEINKPAIKLIKL